MNSAPRSPKANHSTPTPIRTTGINPQHWYVVARSTEVLDQPVSVTLWHRAIVLYRNRAGIVQALANQCPHRRVKLSEGKVRGDRLECAYHGWQFDEQGYCIHIPYLKENQKLPHCQISNYPVRELDGFIWLFPGDRSLLERQSLEPMGIPEWDHLNYIGSEAVIDCPGHFSFLIENLMDMHHGHLHASYQAWASARLQQLSGSTDRVDACYEAQSYYRIDKIWSISQLFFPALRRLHPESLNVSYVYPHWVSSLGEDFRIYCLFCPVSETRTKAYLVHFTSLNAFPKLHQLPVQLRKFLKNRLFGSANKLLEGLVRQDLLMIAQEQQAYLEEGQPKTVEVNPTLGKVQQLIRQQAAWAEAEDGLAGAMMIPPNPQSCRSQPSGG